MVFWTNEEGSRFVPVMMGSRVFAGVFPLETIHAAQDAGKNGGRGWRVSAMSAVRLPRSSDQRLLLKPISSRDRSRKMKKNHRRGAGVLGIRAGTIAW